MTAGQRWRKDKPTAPGWYWFRLAPGHYPIIERYDKDEYGGLVMYTPSNGQLLKFPLAPGEWCGPLEPPHDQEAG